MLFQWTFQRKPNFYLYIFCVHINDMCFTICVYVGLVIFICHNFVIVLLTDLYWVIFINVINCFFLNQTFLVSYMHIYSQTCIYQSLLGQMDNDHRSKSDSLFKIGLSELSCLVCNHSHISLLTEKMVITLLCCSWSLNNLIA